jgi:protein-L-isoaspartate O-methyltransferase
MQQKSLLSVLVNKLLQQGVVKSQEVFDAMMNVDRGEFCDSVSYAYTDSP